MCEKNIFMEHAVLHPTATPSRISNLALNKHKCLSSSTRKCVLFSHIIFLLKCYKIDISFHCPTYSNSNQIYSFMLHMYSHHSYTVCLESLEKSSRPELFWVSADLHFKPILYNFEFVFAA